jgi:hypothetical protein
MRFQREIMKRSRAVILCVALAAGPVAKAEELKLPPEVTPAMRAACESDVRRLCIGRSPSIAKVKRCVAAKFMQLGRRCQIELASAGFAAFSR